MPRDMPLPGRNCARGEYAEHSGKLRRLIDGNRLVRFLKKVAKRLAALVLVLVIGLVGIVVTGLVMFRHTPDWYQIPRLTAEEFEAAAQRVTNKLAVIHNEVARYWASERADRGGGTTTPSDSATHASPEALTITFTADELNAFFEKWSSFNQWNLVYERHLTDPVIILTDNRLILAAKVRELNTIASLHFEPLIDEAGRLRVDLVRILGGRLPLPEAVLGNYRQRVVNSIRQNMPYWRQTADIDRKGAPNGSAVWATMGELLINVLDHHPGEPILFLPLLEQGSVAVRLTDVKIADRALSLTVQPLTAAERAALMDRIRNGEPTALGN